ncbi:MAG TPA: thioredoxin domain-containing protein [Gemmatimonadaceae bacterium]|nr:thioredoxin domain-containing protein [Gemmatimonadaceae bacterium]
MDSVQDWRDGLRSGIRDGPATAPVTIMELADLECPACLAFQPTVNRIRKQYPNQVAVVWVNFPLPYHRFAMGAARAAECAAALGSFGLWRDAVFEQQDSLGLKSWGTFAVAAGIADTGTIAQCARDPAPVAAIQAGRDFGTNIGLTGTPTVIINGWRFRSTPNPAELKAAVDAELHHRRPPGAVAAGN